MSAGKQRWPREAAEAVADELMAALEPHCETLLVCGSIRRLRPTVGDIELVFISRTGTKPDPADLFGQPIPADFAADKVNNLVSEGVISKRVRTDGALTWGAQNKLALHNESKI